MADEVDLAQAHTEAELAAILARREQPKPGLAECAVCGDGITPVRQRLGAQRCLPCQEAIEWHDRVVGGRR